MLTAEPVTIMHGELLERDHVVQSLRQSVTGGTAGIEAVPELVKRVCRDECWRERYVEKTGELVTFRSFMAFVEGAPPEGLGTRLDAIKKLCRDDAEALDALDRAVQAPVGKHRDIDIINITLAETPDGTSAEAALRRLRKDAPELHARVLAGEISPHGAMVEAGFRKRTMTVPVDPERAAVTLSRHFTPEELRQLVSALAAMIDWRG